MSRAGLCVNNIRHATKFWRGPPRRRKGDASELENTIISLKDIAVSFDGEQVLKSFNLDIRDGEFVTLLGPSGCGKTTVLRTIGGFITPDSGEVFFNGKKINDLPPHKRAVNTRCV